MMQPKRKRSKLIRFLMSKKDDDTPKSRRSLVALIFKIAFLEAMALSLILPSVTSTGEIPIKFAHGFNQGGGFCQTSDGNRYATGLGVTVKPTADGMFKVDGQLAFHVSTTSLQVANYEVWETLNATIPNCREIAPFNNGVKLCAFNTGVPGSGGNDIVFPSICSNENFCVITPSFCAVTGNQVSFFFVFQNANGGGFTLTFNGPSSISVQEI